MAGDHDDPWTPVATVRPSRRVRRRFARVLGVDGVAAADAWAWLSTPDRPGPSGAAAPLDRIAVARRSLYRPDPSAAEIEAIGVLERGLLEQREAARAAHTSAAARPRTAPAAVAVPVAAAALLVIAAAFALLRPPDATGPPVRSIPAATRSEDAVPARALPVTAGEQTRLFALLAAATRDPDAARRLRDRVQADIDRTADAPFPADGSGVVPVSGALGGVARGPIARSIDLPAQGAVTLAVVLSRSVPWTADLTGPSGPPLRVAGTATAGRLQHVLLLPGATSLDRLTIRVPGDVRYSWQVLRRV